MGESGGPDTEGMKTVVKSVTSDRNDGIDNNPINNSSSSNNNNKISLKRKATSQPVPHLPPPAPAKAPCPLPKYVDRKVRYKYLEPLGAGTYAAVYKVERLQEGGLFAIKTMPLEHAIMFQNEVGTLQRFPHTNIIAYVSHFRYKDLLHLVLELASHSLHDAIVNRRIDKTTFLEYTAMMAAGVAHLHRNKLLH
ncbi:hypothetical protein EC957_000297, partial [Mortierella hygrophila]